MIERIKLLLPEDYDLPDIVLEMYIEDATNEVEAYCNRRLDKELETIVMKLVIIRINRRNTEGLTAQSYSGINETFVDGYPADILAVLNRKRKPKFL